ncbi:MAG: glycosyltransferase family 4 protein [Nitrospirae bacterium]|nr:glycosyltransferase family 4 protein [Nitrospirota bacterium]
MRCRLSNNNLGVCFIVWDIDTPGGMEKQAWRLARELAEKGMKVTIITSYFAEKSILHKVPWHTEVKDKVTIYRIPLKKSRYIASIIFYIAALFLMLNIRRSFDVIYGVQLYSYGAIACLAGKLFHKPVIVKIACGGYCGDVAMFEKLPFGWLTKRFVRWADTYVSLSNEIEQELIKAGFEKNKIVHIPNGVDTGIFYPVKGIEEKKHLRTKLSLPDKKIILFVGRLDPQKRVDMLINIFKNVHDVCKSAYLIIIGDGPEKEKVLSYLDDNISYIGTVNNVDEYLRASDMLVLPTLSEGMSNVILEAMATGLPVISTNVSSNPEIIEDGIDGILLEVEDKKGLQEKIIKLILNETFAQKIGQNARKKILQQFSIEHIAEKYREIFEKLVNWRKF